jgi:hypothetical protein
MAAKVVPFPSGNVVRDKAEQRRVSQGYAAAIRRKGATPESAWSAATAVSGSIQSESAVQRAMRIAKECRHDQG